MKKDRNSIFCATNSLKILSFLVDNPTKEFMGREIQKSTHISRAGIYLALQELVKNNLVHRTYKGKFLIYSAAYDNPAVKQFKILRNVLLLHAAVAKLSVSSKRIVLYGSASRGEDDSSSDIDLFVLSQTPDTVKEVLALLRLKRKIQAVVKTPAEIPELQEKDKVFWGEVERGIVLWEEKE